MSDMAGIVRPKKVWRVSEDGLIADRYKVLKRVFEMPEVFFFEHYSRNMQAQPTTYYDSCRRDYDEILSILPSLPLSHIWCASQLYDKLPKNSTLHLGILSPLRSWSYFSIDPSIEVWCNQGGFGIDGNMSSLVGASLMHPERLFFGAVGDLSFFYDMNILGNRHIGNNVRILLINNGLGAEFHLFKQTNLTFVNDIEKYLSAGGHFGRKSPDVVKHLVTDLGFEYITASTKEEFNAVYERFIAPEMTDKPMLFEVFTEVQDEDKALYDLWHIMKDTSVKGMIKKGVKEVLGEEMTKKVKGIIKK